jgi:hypothetical protein
MQKINITERGNSSKSARRCFQIQARRKAKIKRLIIIILQASSTI